MSDFSPLEDERLSALLATAQLLAADSSVTPSASPPPTRSRRTLALAAVVVVVGLAAGGFVLSRRGTEDDQARTPTATTVAVVQDAPASVSSDDVPVETVLRVVPSTAATLTTTATITTSTVASAPGSAAPDVSSAPTVQLLTGTPAEFLPGGQPWPNGLYIDAIMHMRGTVPDEQTSRDLQQRVEQILGAGSVSNEFVIDPTAAAVETVIVRLGQSVLFKSGSDEINPEYYGGFALWGSFLQSNPDVTMTVIGHTDDQGTVEYNLKLSQQRAEAARQKIIENGIDGSRVDAVSVGFEDPIADNDTSVGRALNRRIEFAVTGLFVRPDE